MNNFLKVTLLLFITLILSTPDTFAQRKNKKESDGDKGSKYENYTEPEVIIIKASERGSGLWGIEIDAGVDIEGNQRSIAGNKREEELLEKLIDNASLPELLGIILKRGYIINNSYALGTPGKGVFHYFVLSRQDLAETQSEMYRKRTNQNKPQMSPDEINMRRKMREKQDR